MIKYSDEFKAQIVKECQQIDNVALVARRYNIAYSTVYGWIKKAKKILSKDVEKQLKKLNIENDKLKKLLAEKELELAILRDQ